MDINKILDLNPWDDLDQTIDKLIDKTILELNPMAIDDEISDLTDDIDNRLEALDYLTDKLIKIRKELND